MERAAAHLEPPRFPHLRMNIATQCEPEFMNRQIEGIAIRLAEYEHIDVTDRTVARLAMPPRRPRSEDVHLTHAFDALDCMAEPRRHSERSNEQVTQGAKVRATHVGAHQPRLADASRGDETGALGALDLAVHRRCRDTQSTAEICERLLTCWRVEDVGEQLDLLPRSEDRQQFRTR